MFLHCHNCNWEQDDFWDQHYNPARSVLDWESELINNDLNQYVKLETKEQMQLREIIAKEFEKKAYLIRQMRYQTIDQFKENNPNGVCPSCGKRTLDID